MTVGGLSDANQLTAANTFVNTALKNVPEEYEGIRSLLLEAQGTIVAVLADFEEGEGVESVTFEDAPAAEDVYQGD